MRRFAAVAAKKVVAVIATAEAYAATTNAVNEVAVAAIVANEGGGH